VLRSAQPIPVVDGDERIGVIDAGQLLPALIGHRPPVPA
jgi:glycine betaine/proline transport system ATP-binding protein